MLAPTEELYSDELCNYTTDRPAWYSQLSQVVTAVFLGIPLSIALFIAIAVFCAYELVKYSLVGERTLEFQTEPDGTPAIAGPERRDR